MGNIIPNVLMSSKHYTVQCVLVYNIKIICKGVEHLIDYLIFSCT